MGRISDIIDNRPYQKYFFEIYRPMTLERIGFDDYADLEIDDEFFKSACKYYEATRNESRSIRARYKSVRYGSPDVCYRLHL